MQNFFIKKGSTNPVLRMEIVNNGRYDFSKFYNAVQDADITFSMRNIKTGLLKVSKANAELCEIENDGCEEKYALCYKWKERDTKEEGVFNAWFEINFRGNISEEGVSYPTGNLIVPIAEELMINVN